MHILVLQGHPDGSEPHLCHGLADAYAEGAEAAGHHVERLSLTEAPVEFLRSRRDWQEGARPAYVIEAQEAIRRADHVVLVFPLWLGGVPALVKAWLEQVFREGFAMSFGEKGWQRHLKGKSARLVVTMSMPAFFYRLYFRSHGTRQISRSILGFSGIGPIRETLVGMVDSVTPERFEKLRAELAALGRAGR
ncbi:MAG: NAD(P)H-dependent oxidoreductase [Pseudooceanicola sp.]